MIAIYDASRMTPIWAIRRGGRPVAICKIEQYDRGRQDQTWLYCLASLSEQKIGVNWRDGETWAAKEAGVTNRNLPDAPSVYLIRCPRTIRIAVLRVAASYQNKCHPEAAV